MTELVEFLRARIADPIGDSSPTCCMGSGEYWSCDQWSDWHEKTLQAMLFIVDSQPVSPDAIEEWGDTCRCFARIWSGHPDFLARWA